jgi:hypothetical protein
VLCNERDKAMLYNERDKAMLYNERDKAMLYNERDNAMLYNERDKAMPCLYTILRYPTRKNQDLQFSGWGLIV